DISADHSYIRRNVVDRLGADTAGVQQGGRSKAAAALALGGSKDVLPLKEEGSLLFKEGLERAEVHHHVIRFDRAKIGVQRGGKLHVGAGSPVHVGAYTVVCLVLHVVEGGRAVGIEGELGGWVDVSELVLLEGRQIFAIGVRQRRP